MASESVPASFSPTSLVSKRSIPDIPSLIGLKSPDTNRRSFNRSTPLSIRVAPVIKIYIKISIPLGINQKNACFILSLDVFITEITVVSYQVYAIVSHKHKKKRSQ